MIYSVTKEVEVEIDADEIVEAFSLDLELLGDLIAQGDNMEALEYLNRYFPNHIRPPKAILRLVRDRGHKTFQDKKVA